MIDKNDRLEAIKRFKFKAQDGTEYSIFDFIYPVGCLYWSNEDTNPSELFGGTWVQIKDRFVLACGDTYKTVGETGGASSVTLSVSNMPSHNHSFTPSGDVTSTFTGTTATGTFGGVRSQSGGTTEATGVFSWGATHNWIGRRHDTYGYMRGVNFSMTPNGSVNSTFRGYTGTTSSNGSGSAFNILPPYVVKYCWERTA